MHHLLYSGNSTLEHLTYLAMCDTNMLINTHLSNIAMRRAQFEDAIPIQEDVDALDTYLRESQGVNLEEYKQQCFQLKLDNYANTYGCTDYTPPLTDSE